MKNRVRKCIMASWYKNKVIVTPFYSTLEVILKWKINTSLWSQGRLREAAWDKDYFTSHFISQDSPHGSPIQFLPMYIFLYFFSGDPLSPISANYIYIHGGYPLELRKSTHDYIFLKTEVFPPLAVISGHWLLSVRGGAWRLCPPSTLTFASNDPVQISTGYWQRQDVI